MGSDETINKLRSMIGKSNDGSNTNKDLLKSFDDGIDKKKEEMRYNIVCYEVTSVIFNKVVELMKKDNTLNAFKKGLIVSTVTKNKDSIQDYVLKMDSDDARDLINDINNLIKSL